jgi:tetratricopeptide (TPR) repeat protein
MKKEVDHIELIEKYIEKRTTDEELKEFNRLLSEDSSFQDLYKTMAAHIAGIKNSARKGLLNDLKKFDDKLPEVPLKKPLRRKGVSRWIGWSVAAACAAGIIWAIITFTPNNNKRFDNIYTAYYKPYRNVVVSYNRSGDKAGSLKEEAFSKYAQGDYAQAIEKFQEINNKNQDAVIHFYLANAYMASGKMSKAQENFRLVLANNDSLFKDQTKWFLALSYLKCNRTNKATELLKELINHKNTYKTKATEIISLIKPIQ